MSREGSGLFRHHVLWPAGGPHRPHWHPAALQPQEPRCRNLSWLHGLSCFFRSKDRCVMCLFCNKLSNFIMSHVADRGVHQFDWWPTNYNEMEISLGEVQSLCEGTGTGGLSVTRESCVQIMLCCLIDTSFHKDEDGHERNGSGLLIGWPRRGEPAHVRPAAALNSAHIEQTKKQTFCILFCGPWQIALWKDVFCEKYIIRLLLIYVIYLIYYRNIKSIVRLAVSVWFVQYILSFIDQILFIFQR